jgi:hypothetical protein
MEVVAVVVAILAHQVHEVTKSMDPVEVYVDPSSSA